MLHIMFPRIYSIQYILLLYQNHIHLEYTTDHHFWIFTANTSSLVYEPTHKEHKRQGYGLTNDNPPYDFNSSIMACFLAPSASARGFTITKDSIQIPIHTISTELATVNINIQSIAFKKFKIHHKIPEQDKALTGLISSN